MPSRASFGGFRISRDARVRQRAAGFAPRAAALVVGLGLLGLAAAFAQSAEFAVARPAALARLSEMLWPRGAAFLLLFPAMFVGVAYLNAPRGRKEWLFAALFSVAAAATVLPVQTGVKHQALYLALGTLGSVGIAASVAPLRGRIGATVGRVVEKLTGVTFRSFLLGACGVQAATTLLISATVFGGVPHVQDSVAQLFHARILTQGALTPPAPPVPEAFEYSHLIISDRW